MTSAKYPSISFILLSYNDKIGVDKCLHSIAVQEYPQEKIEIIVVDDGSTDGTLEVAKKYKARILTNGTHDMYLSWGMGLHAVKNEFTYLIEQDIELRDPTFLKQMMKPLVEDPTLAGSFTRKYPRKDQSWTNQYIAHHPAQCDPLYEFFSPTIASFMKEERDGYAVIRYSPGHIAPISRIMYRMAYLKKIPIWKEKRFFDFETLLAMIATGYTDYAYVPTAGIYHHHATSLSHLLSKRVRNLKAHYIQTTSPYKYSWFDTSSIQGLSKIALWILYANLFFPATIRGIYRTIKERDLVMMLEPVITIATTNVILYTMLTDPKTRSFMTALLGNTAKRLIGGTKTAD